VTGALFGSRPHLAHAAMGLLLGFGLSEMGFSDFGEVQKMFRLADLRLFFTFLLAVGLTMAGLALVGRGRALPKKALHRGSIAGGLLFGVGWAVTGACPAVAMVQLGEGRLPALFTLGGIVLGTWGYGKVHARYLRFDSGTCAT
jgi:uncharacterized protein